MSRRFGGVKDLERESGPQVFNPLFLFTSKVVTLEEVIVISVLILSNITIRASMSGGEI